MTEKTLTAAQKKSLPSSAINIKNPMAAVIFLGAKFTQNVRNAIIGANLTMTTDAVTELELVMADNKFALLQEGLFQLDVSARFDDMYLAVASVDTGVVNGNEQITVRCRSRYVRKLKNRRGTKVMKNTSPSSFVEAECRAVGVKAVCQTTSKRKQVARDHAKSGTNETDIEPPSSWTTFKRLADEVGFIMFESAGTVYFGKPSWLLKRSKTGAITVNWRTGDPSTQPNSVPVCTRSQDNEKNAVTVSFDLPLTLGRGVRPGHALKLNGVPTFNGYYLVNSVSYSLLQADVVSIDAGTPIDPDRPGSKKKSSSSSGGSGYHGGRSLRAVLKYVGFSGNGLEIATAIVMAESKADATALGDRNLTDGKWGPSVGLFQIRSLRHPKAYTGSDRLRDATDLKGAILNARAAYAISDHGKNWSAWSTFHSGAYKHYYKTKKNYQITHWTPPKVSNSGGTSKGGSSKATGRTGTKRASDFVYFALKQAGDKYVYGAEASIKNPNPNAFDCSELVQWAAGRAGVYIPDGSSNQHNYCKKVSVSHAVKTRGALLWKPGHIAISLGNGKTIEALNPYYGVRQMSATNRSFKWSAGLIVPHMKY